MKAGLRVADQRSPLRVSLRISSPPHRLSNFAPSHHFTFKYHLRAPRSTCGSRSARGSTPIRVVTVRTLRLLRLFAPSRFLLFLALARLLSLHLAPLGGDADGDVPAVDDDGCVIFVMRCEFTSSWQSKCV